MKTIRRLPLVPFALLAAVRVFAEPKNHCAEYARSGY
jgi:hypothetical protein